MFDNRRFKCMTNRLFFVLSLCVFLTGVNAQSPKTGPPAVKAPPADATPPPGYDFTIVIDADKTSSLHVSTGYEGKPLDAVALQRAMLEYVRLQKPVPRQPLVDPRISLHPDGALDVGTLTNVIKSLRVSAGTVVTIYLGQGPVLIVHPAPKFDKSEELRPDPIFLLTAVDEAGKIHLNNEPQGSLSNMASLDQRLKEVFKAREDNGVMRENTHDIEKTVWLSLPAGSKVTDLIKIATAVKMAGSDRIGLWVDDLTLPEEPDLKEFLDTRPIPKP
jgi:biopolymer transport protein ExbD